MALSLSSFNGTADSKNQPSCLFPLHDDSGYVYLPEELTTLTQTAIPGWTFGEPVFDTFLIELRKQRREDGWPNIKGVSTQVLGDSSSECARSTTVYENIIGEIRQWHLLRDNWDSEGAIAPNPDSIREAVSFVRLLNDNFALPEPMLLASGHAALFWNDEGLYADIEFLGDRRIAYFIKKNGCRHKGILTFDKRTMPVVLQTLIKG